MKDSLLVPPYGGVLVDLATSAEQLEELKSYANRLPCLHISERSVCDLQLLASGAFSPLDRFVGEEDHARILDEMRLQSGHLFPIPVTLPVEAVPELRLDSDITLRNARNELMAILTVETIYKWDFEEVTLSLPQRPVPKLPTSLEKPIPLAIARVFASGLQD